MRYILLISVVIVGLVVVGSGHDVDGGLFSRRCPPGGCGPGGGGGGGKPPKLDIPIEQLILDVPGVKYDDTYPSPGDLVAPVPDSVPRQWLEGDVPFAKINPEKYPSMALPPAPIHPWEPRPVDIEALVAAVIKDLPPVTIQIELPDGQVISLSRPFGKAIRIRVVAH